MRKSENLKKGEKNNYWLGGQLSDDLNWKWITDEKFSYSNWSPNQPDNFTSCEDSLMVYRVPNPLDTAGPDLGKWNDLCHDGTCNGESFFGTDNFGDKTLQKFELNKDICIEMASYESSDTAIILSPK